MTTMPATHAAAMSLIERIRATQLPDPPRRRAIRLAVGGTLREVARDLGVSQLTVSQWERGRSEPRPDHAIRYRELLEKLEAVAAEIERKKAS